MIDGLKFRIPGAKLAAHFEKRCAAHRARLKHYEDELERIAKEPPIVPPAAPPGYSSPIGGLVDNRAQLFRQSADEHARKAGWFHFAAMNTVRDETYEVAMSYSDSALELDKWDEP